MGCRIPANGANRLRFTSRNVARKKAPQNSAMLHQNKESAGDTDALSKNVSDANRESREPFGSAGDRCGAI